MPTFPPVHQIPPDPSCVPFALGVLLVVLILVAFDERKEKAEAKKKRAEDPARQ